MSFLRARGPKPAEIPQFTGLQVQTSSNAVPIPIVYGINKVAPNIIWTGAFQAIPQYTKTGGKGGGRKTLSGYQYKTGLVMGLCEGQITSIGTIWNGQSTAATWTLGLSVFYGSTPQTSWGYLSANFPDQALPYGGLAYVVSGAYDLGQSASLGSLQFEVYGIAYPSAHVNARDADPAIVVYDFLTNSQYGVQFPAASIDATTLFGASGTDTYQAYCQAVGLAFSPVLANQESANAILTRWLKLTNTAAVWSGGKLKFLPYGDTHVDGTLYDGSAVSYNPSVTPVYNLTDDDFVGDGEEDPVQVERKDPYALFNLQEIEIAYRWSGYNSSTIAAWDQNAIEVYGLRRGPTLAAHEITESYIAQKIAQLVLQRELYVRTTYSFRLSFEYCLLEPMDVVTLTDAMLGLNSAAVRIVSIEEDEDGILNVVAEEFPGATGTAAVYPVEVNQATVLDHAIVPSAVNPPVIFEPPASLTNGQAQVWVAVSGGLATAWKITEGTSNGYHYASKTMASQASGTSVQFSIFVQAAERTFCALQIFDGVTYQNVSFNLAAGTSFGVTAGVTSYSITPISGGTWHQAFVACNMAATAAPVVSVLLEDATASTFYTGVSGNGLYVWGARFEIGSNGPFMISMPMTASGGSFIDVGVTTPEGVEGTADPYWGGCLIHISTDNATYGQIGQINGPARHGVLSASLSDIGTTLSVDLSQSGGALPPAAAAEAQNGITLSLVENELLAYGGTTLTGTNAYDLTTLVRGLHGTIVPSSHASGARFARLDDAIFKYALPAAYVGQTLYLKFQSFNIFGQALQDLSTCTTYTYAPNGVGAGLGAVAAALAIGANLDYGLGSEPTTTMDDFGLASDPNVTIIDLGLASA